MPVSAASPIEGVASAAKCDIASYPSRSLAMFVTARIASVGREARSPRRSSFRLRGWR